MNNFFLFSLTHALSLTRTCMYASHTHIHRSIITRARDRDRQPLLSTAFFGLPSLSPFRRTSSRQLRRDRLPCTHHMTHTAKESARAHTHTHTHTQIQLVSVTLLSTRPFLPPMCLTMSYGDVCLTRTSSSTALPIASTMPGRLNLPLPCTKHASRGVV